MQAQEIYTCTSPVHEDAELINMPHKMCGHIQTLLSTANAEGYTERFCFLVGGTFIALHSTQVFPVEIIDTVETSSPCPCCHHQLLYISTEDGLRGTTIQYSSTK